MSLVDTITVIRTKLTNRLEEEKLAKDNRDAYPEGSEEYKQADKEVQQIHDRIMALTFQLKGLTTEQKA